MSTIATICPPTLTLAGVDFFILPAQYPGARCLVPTTVVSTKDGSVYVDVPAYVESSWASWNMLLNLGRAMGSHIFPKQGSEPLDPASANLAEFVREARRRFGK